MFTTWIEFVFWAMGRVGVVVVGDEIISIIRGWPMAEPGLDITLSDDKVSRLSGCRDSSKRLELKLGRPQERHAYPIL